MSNIVFDKTDQYIKILTKINDPDLIVLADYAKENNVPIVTKEIAKFLQTMVAIHKPTSILEVGCAIGYSAILFAKAQKNAKIITVERNPVMIDKAKENFSKYGLEDRIKLIEGDALELIKSIEGSFDMVFIDAGKSHYKIFFEDLIAKVKPGGLIISDNVLFKGKICDDDLVDRRNRTIVRNMREYLEFISTDPRFETSVIPMGDGIAITYLKEDH